jgi:mono/diheme cytochrome c family protein
MRDQPKFEPLEENDFFADRRASRPLPDGTVPRSEGLDEPDQYSPRDANGELLDSFPFEVDLDVLQRGRERYDIFCSPCHGSDGYGQGMIVQRGFSQPPSLHDQRLRESPAGYFYEVITNGFGRMYAYNDRIAPRDRWAVAAYIRALQLSQNATENDVPPEERQNIQEANP